MVTSNRLLSNITQFKSPYDSNYVLTNKRYYTKNPRRPLIEEQIINDNQNITRSVSMKGPKGSSLNIVELNGDFIKVLRDEFGNILHYKSNLSFYPKDVEKVYKNLTELVHAKLLDFFASQKLV